MMHGVNRVKRLKGTKSTRTFGATAPTYQSFDLDAGFGYPDQNVDGNPEDCTIYIQNELCQDEDKVEYNRDFLKKKVVMQTGHEGPYDIYDSLGATVVYGVQKPTEKTDEEAYTHRRGRAYRLEKILGLDWFDSAISVMQSTGRTLSIAGPWFPSFEFVGSTGKLPENFPLTWPDGVPGHNSKVSGLKTYPLLSNGYLIGKSLQGTAYGDNGKHYWSRTAFNRYMSMAGTGAFMVSTYVGDAVDIQYGIFYNLKFQIALFLRKLGIFVP